MSKKTKTKKLTKKQIKEMQANKQSDMQDWTLGGGELNVGTATYTAGTLDNDFEITYGQMDFGFDEQDMRKKYPALKQAWEHYKSVLEVCKTKEQEDDA